MSALEDEGVRANYYGVDRSVTPRWKETLAESGPSVVLQALSAMADKVGQAGVDGQKAIRAYEALSRDALHPLAGHRSDCAVHNEPAMPNGPCNCGADSPPETP